MVALGPSRAIFVNGPTTAFGICGLTTCASALILCVAGRTSRDKTQLDPKYTC
ncbi:hypothetical protein JAAARDRAFT_38842 [Jaapia argillacea MUCL 33604]|uniref:Uncharacterized protein n=1 Tax=Jaapia argillacea MUCL 33604 TaxID=933084 RepID=A0A067PG35_9AGAM|nr:hypothetical protein JAAARDRAFT_38842 [Jaapia argillacea MUCL 33604]